MRPLKLNTVLAAIDLGPSSVTVLRSAHLLAQSAGADLHVVHVCDGDPASAGATAGAAAASAKAMLRDAGIPEHAAAMHVIPGAVAGSIRALGDRIAADTIVLGPPRGAPGEDRPLGSTARVLVERTYVPILITPRPLTLPLGEVLVPIDLSETARGALLVALTWASALRRRDVASEATCVTALHVTLPGDADEARTALTRELDHVRSRAVRWAGVALRELVTEATDPAAAIATQARAMRADLVVLGTRGTRAHEGEGLGSVSAAAATVIEAPTLLVPPGVWQAFAGSE